MGRWEGKKRGKSGHFIQFLRCFGTNHSILSMTSFCAWALWKNRKKEQRKKILTTLLNGNPVFLNCNMLNKVSALFNQFFVHHPLFSYLLSSISFSCICNFLTFELFPVTVFQVQSTKHSYFNNFNIYSLSYFSFNLHPWYESKN